MEEIKISVSEKTAQRLKELAASLGVSREELIAVTLDVIGDYANELREVAEELKVGKEKRHQSAMEELVFYGIEAYGLVRAILSSMGATGCYELEELSIEPNAALLEVELVALEGCPFQADRLSIAWSPEGVRVEAYYYAESPERPGKIEAEWFYLPDEGAIVIAFTGKELPRIEQVEEEFKKLVGSNG